MPAVTVNSRKHNVIGSLRQHLFNVTGTTGDTLTVGMRNVKIVNTEGPITYTVAAGGVPGTSVITLTGTLSGTDIEVIGN
jgi:hypothetical protein